MPLIDDPRVRGSLLTPRGFVPLLGADEVTNPVDPEPEVAEPVLEVAAPTGIEKAIQVGLNIVSPRLGDFFTHPTVQSAFRTENTIGSAIAQANDLAGVDNILVDPNYSPWTDVVGTKYEPYWRSTFAYSNNRSYTEALKRSVDRQEDDRRMIDASGVGGYMSAMLAGTLDPTILLPGAGEISLASKGVWTIARGVGKGARAGAGGMAVQEGFLQATQDVRTAEESAFAIGTGTILGGVIGGTIASALTRSQRVGSEAALEKIEQINNGSLSAAATEKFTLDDLTVHGKVTEKVAAGTAFSPSLRGNFRESPLARQTYQELATNTLRQTGEMEGKTVGGSVESNILVSLGETLNQAAPKHAEIFQDAKKKFGMSSSQFDEAVGRAMRRGDVGENEAVTRAAQMWRSTAIEPLTKQAIELELLPKDVTVVEAPSYFMRWYNQEMMTAKKPDFIELAKGHYNDVLTENYQRDAFALREKQAELDKELADLQPKGKKKAKPDQVAKMDEIKLKKADLDRNFYNKWEIRRLGEGVSPYQPDVKPDFSYHSEDMANETFDAITGQDYGSASVDPSMHMTHKSGPLKDRTFHIPDEKIEGFLQDNVMQVMARFTRTMAAQIELARKFPGDPTLENRFKEIKREYDELDKAATTEAERKRLKKDREGAFNDLRSLVELHRGSYLTKENASSFGRTVRGLMNFNYIRLMGGSVIPSLSEIYNPAIFHGSLRSVDMLANKLGKNIAAIKGLEKEGRYAGVAERLVHHRLLTMAEIGDPYSPKTSFERLLESGSHLASKWNGLNMLTDFQKSFDSVVVQDRLNTALLQGKEDDFLAYSGMNETTRGQVKAQLEKYGTEIDGITVANTDQWDNWNAVRAYRVAINKNINADIVTRGIGDVPLFAYTPLGKLILQFKTFSLAAHQRTMLRSMQLGKAQFMSSMIGLTTLGMLASVFKALRGGKENWEKYKVSAENPGFLIAEGLDNTGLFTLPLMVGDMTEKTSSLSGYAVNPVKTPLLLGGRIANPDASIQGNAQRFASRSPLEAALGPSAGILGDTALAAGAAIDSVVSDEEVKQSKINAARRLVPYQSYLGMREILQVATDDSPYVGE